MKRFLWIFLILVGYLLFLKLPVLKNQVNESKFYYKDILGFVHKRHSSCGFLGPCISLDSPIFGAHSKAFKLINYQGLECLDAYAKSINSVYYLGKKRKQVTDPKTFELLNNYYAKDSENAYRLCDLEVIKDVTAPDFNLVGSVCAKDLNAVYCFRNQIVGADATTFEHFHRGYYRDKAHVYYLGKLLEDVDSESLVLLGWGYLTDEDEVYFLSESSKTLIKMEEVDRLSFEVLEDGYAQDVNRKYRNGVEKRF